MTLGPASPMAEDPSSPLGATPVGSGTRFALWSTTARVAAVRLFDGAGRPQRTERLEPLGEGLFVRTLAGVGPGALYKFVLDDRELPDPYARFLPDGVHGPARVEPVVSEGARRAFEALPFERWSIYELHVGAFTSEGTWDAARERLDGLVELGVTTIEVMPVAAFAGARGWGYDGVALFAPHPSYGSPEALRGFVAACHERGLAVILDVVYNHFGPAGNYLGAYAPEYFTSRHATMWGDAPDFAEPHLRRLVLANARYWLQEFEFDGLRLDATHAIVDDSPTHILSELASLAAGLSPRRILVAEDERNEPGLVTAQHLDAVWADDFHHALAVALTRERDGYYEAYEPCASGLARTIEQGWLYEGQVYPPSGCPRGCPATRLAASNLVYCVQNHDQVGNRPFGTRLHQDAGIEAYAAASVLLLFLPMIPLLFMGQEWAASSPFLYFTDHDAELGRAVTQGRRGEFRHFRGFADPELAAQIPDPQAESTFLRSRLDWTERTATPHARILALYKTLLALRARDLVLSSPSRARMACEARGALLVIRRWLGAEERVLLFNTGSEAVEAPVPVPIEDLLVASADVPSGRQIPPLCAVVVRRPR